MRYTETVPCDELSPFINCFWSIEDSSECELNDISFPDGCVEIIFNIGSPMFRAPEDHPFEKNPAVELIGQMTQSYRIKSVGKKHLIGVRFYPHTAACFLFENISKLNNSIFNAEDVLGSQIKDLQEKLINAPDENRRILFLQNFFVRILKRKNKLFALTQYAVKNIFIQKETAGLKNIALDCGITDRYLQQIFNERVGISPKMLIKIIRFQKTFKYLNKEKLPLTSIAYECNYFDQSHFIRDFKMFTGNIPSKYLLQSHPLNRFFLSDLNSSYLYNFGN